MRRLIVDRAARSQAPRPSTSSARDRPSSAPTVPQQRRARKGPRRLQIAPAPKRIGCSAAHLRSRRLNAVFSTTTTPPYQPDCAQTGCAIAVQPWSDALSQVPKLAWQALRQHDDDDDIPVAGDRRARQNEGLEKKKNPAAPCGAPTGGPYPFFIPPAQRTRSVSLVLCSGPSAISIRLAARRSNLVGGPAAVNHPR